jgi:predicted enzyme related to lactoylglutathione lyase
MADLPRIQNVFYAVGDLAGSRRFYEGLVAPETRFADGERWVQYNLGGINFALGSAGEPHPSMKGAALVFEVASFDGYEDRIARFGGTLLERRTMASHGTALVVSDPSGNVLHLWCRALVTRITDRRNMA